MIVQVRYRQWLRRCERPLSTAASLALTHPTPNRFELFADVRACPEALSANRTKTVTRSVTKTVTSLVICCVHRFVRGAGATLADLTTGLYRALSTRPS